MAEPMLPAPAGTLSVSELTRYVKYIIEGDSLLGEISVRGEVCDLSRSLSGHLYLTIKDSASQIPCVLFRREAQRQVHEIQALRKGISVVVHGFLTVYEPRTVCQIYIQQIVLEGQGALSERFERLKLKLEAEGLFASERKRSLPGFPKKVALITSPRGQAYHDVLHRLQAQYPFVVVVECAVAVQGDGAADEMVLAIDIVNRLTDADVILLVRGGGAAEDLAAYNEERLARAVYASRIPVISGVGHEADHTIVDFVADHRAATPSLAAAAAVPDIASLVQRSAQLHRQARAATRERLGSARQSWISVNRALLRASPQNRLQEQVRRASELRHVAEGRMSNHLRVKRARLDSLRAQLQTLDPLAVLQRGYAVLTDEQTGAVVRSVHQAKPGARLRARLADGSFATRVENA